MEFIVCYFRVALESQILYINACLQAELIGISSMRITHKTTKLFTCLGSSSQLGQSITHYTISALY